MPRIGYARVSTADQDLDTQLAKLKAEGCDMIRAEKVSGGSREGRGELATIIEFLRPGDELVVTRLDRLGRDTRGCTRGEAGRIVMTVLGMVAQMERRFIRERQREGIERAKAEGVYRGGKRRVCRETAKAMAAAGHGPAAIANAVGCSRMQVYRILAEAGAN